jgi:hypothetical protein
LAECTAEIDLRVPSQQLAEEMTHWFLGLEPIGANVEVTVSGGMNRPPYQKDAGIAQLFGKAQALYREIGNHAGGQSLKTALPVHRHCHQRRRSLVRRTSFNSRLSRVTKSSVACKRACSSRMLA